MTLDVFGFDDLIFSSVMNGEQKPGRKIDRKELHLLPTSCQRLVAPAVEIYSVSIHSNRVFKDVEKRDIYGRISVVDDLGDEFDIFVRGRDDPECIHLNAALLLSDPCKPVSVELSSAKTQVRMLLLDKAHDDVVVAQGVVRLEPSNGKLKYGFVNGDNGGFASVHYAIFPYAVTATVQVLYFSKDHDFDLFKDTQKPDYDEDNYDSDGGFLDEHFDMYDNVNYDNLVCGTSIAGVYGTFTAANDSVSDASVLFRLPPEKCVQVTSGSFIKLSRSVVAVPAYSSLRIEVDLSDCNTQLPIGRSSVEFMPRDSMKFKKDIIGECGRIRVRVKWSDAYQQLDRARELKLPSNGHVALPCRMPPALLMNYHPKIELFSVFVHGKDFEPLSIYGKITVTSANYCIYKRGANCPQQCPALGTNVQLDCHRSFYLVDDFGLWVKLKDINKKYAIIYGHMIWGPFNLKPQSKWLDRRLCSLIRGDGGFAILHYEIISDGLAAKVDVKLYGKTQQSRVFGKLFTCYGNHEYRSSHEKENYQSVLFHKDVDDDLPLQMCGSSLPLSKSVVAFPRNSSLIFVAEMSVSSMNDGSKLHQETESLQGDLEFKLDIGGEFSGRISGQNSYIVVSVECHRGFYY